MEYQGNNVIFEAVFTLLEFLQCIFITTFPSLSKF